MERILKILNELRPEFDFIESEHYIEDGLLDSFDVIGLIAEIEEQFEITIDGLDIVPENFVNCEAIMELIKKSGGSI